ncbi:threonylcarbamoyl-AMP synthase [Patescibacteria group bacterium]|nr:threonylcarbamoyl-AMP synthase [Patescibacteria group bacterium]
MKIVKLTSTNRSKIITQAIKTLKTNGLIIYPTETCYGAGVDATNQKAVNKLLSYKTFRQGKPLSIAVANQTMASKYIIPNTTALNLYTKFLPGPLTVISRGLNKVAKKVQSETGTLGVRIPDYPLIIKIITKLNRPITATSANASYKKRPYSIKDILKNTSKKQQSLIDLIIDAGTLPKRPTSTIVDTTLDDLLVLRKGGSELSAACNAVKGSSEPSMKNSIHSRSGNFFHSESVQLTTTSPKQTINLAQTLMLKHWNTLQKQPLMFLLVGELGTGKTQFCKGIGKFLKIKQIIASPTYTIEKEYPYTRHSIKGLFLHLDTWRIQNIEELDQLNLKSRLKPKTIIAIEWANRTYKPLLSLAKKTNAKVITIKISSESSPSHRRLTFHL